MAKKLTFYEVLGVAEDADAETLRKAYRQLALKHHPDASGDLDDRMFVAVNRAYQRLRDPEKRRQYDAALKKRRDSGLLARPQPTQAAEPTAKPEPAAAPEPAATVPAAEAEPARPPVAPAEPTVRPEPPAKPAPQPRPSVTRPARRRMRPAHWALLAGFAAVVLAGGFVVFHLLHNDGEQPVPRISDVAATGQPSTSPVMATVKPTTPIVTGTNKPATPPIAPVIATPASPGKELVLDLGNNVTMKLVEIPAGKFMMGSTNGEWATNRFKEDQHEATISKPFFMGIYTVTQEQYEPLMGKLPAQSNTGPTYPVERVTWDNAREYCTRLSKKTGKTVTLPTEAQWEYACRAGTTTMFNTGADLGEGLANYAGSRRSDDRKSGATPVGSFKPNAYGLYDMHGNVEQWCADEFYRDYNPVDQASPPGGDSPTYRVLRGGNWCGPPNSCRSAYRRFAAPGPSAVGVGFRVVVIDGVATANRAERVR